MRTNAHLRMMHVQCLILQSGRNGHRLAQTVESKEVEAAAAVEVVVAIAIGINRDQGQDLEEKEKKDEGHIKVVEIMNEKMMTMAEEEDA